MISTRMTALIGAGVALGFLGISASFVWLNGGGDDQFAQCRQGNVAGAAAIGGPFELVNENGAVVTDKDVLSKPAFVYFGYTFCPDVCPLDTARNADAVDILAGLGYNVLPVMISVDPARDTPEVLAEYTDYIHQDMVGLTGSPEQVKAASQAYRAYFKAQPAEDDYYLVDHSVYTYLMLPDTGFAEFFGRDVSAEDMAKRSACFIKAAG